MPSKSIRPTIHQANRPPHRAHSNSCWGIVGMPSRSYLMVPIAPVSGSNT